MKKKNAPWLGMDFDKQVKKMKIELKKKRRNKINK